MTLRYFYRRFEDAPIERLEQDSLEMMSDLLGQSFPAGIRRVRALRALGHKTLLITGRSMSSSNRCGLCSITSCRPNSVHRTVTTTASSPTSRPPVKPAIRPSPITPRNTNSI